MKKVYSAPRSSIIILDSCSSLLVGSDVIEKNNRRGNGVQLSNQKEGNWDWQVDSEK